MFHYYKKTLFLLKEKLNALNSSPTNDKLFELQKILITKIKDIECRITRVKNEIRESKKARRSGATSKEFIKRLQNKLDFYQHLLIIYKSFGDGILFIYIDRMNIRSLMYDSNMNDLPRNGFLSGKAGFKLELKILSALIDQGIPALLSDITNTIRHGDICVLIGPDPYVFEVKTSKNKNARTERQEQKLIEFYKYMTEDKFVTSDGMPCIRVSSPSDYEIKEHTDIFNDLLDKAASESMVFQEPESGLYYTSFHDGEGFGIFSNSILIDGPIIHQVINFSDTIYQWGHFYPFVLSIKSQENLYNFIIQKFYILIFIKIKQFSDYALSRGFRVEFDSSDEKGPIKIYSAKHEDPHYLTGNGITRIAREFISFKEIFNRSEHIFESTNDIVALLDSK